MRFTSLDEIVRDIISVQLGSEGTNQYLRVSRAVKAGINEVQLTFLPSIQSSLLEVGTNLIVNLPPDHITITKVGILTSDGKIVTLIQNSHLRRVEYDKLINDIPEYCECEVPPPSAVDIPITSEACNIFHNCLWWNSRYGELYAAGNGMDFEGGWRYNMDAGVIEMASGTLVQPGVKVLVEYKSLDNEQYTMVPIVAKETIEAFAMYKLFLNRPQLSAYYMQEFRRMAAELKRKVKPFDTLGVLNAFMRGQKGTVK